MIPMILTVIVVWFRSPAGWIDVLLMIAMTSTLVLPALVMAMTYKVRDVTD
jgi:hypothetical protein